MKMIARVMIAVLVMGLVEISSERKQGGPGPVPTCPAFPNCPPDVHSLSAVW